MAEPKDRGSMRQRYGYIISGLITSTVVVGIYAMAQDGFLDGLSAEDNIRAFLAFIFGFGTIIMVFLSVLFIVYADDKDQSVKTD